MFRIEFFSDPHKFLAVMGPIYENDESCAILPLGVALRIAEDIAAYGKHQPLLAVVRDDQDYVAASAVMTPPQRLLVYSDMPDEEALAILAEEIWEQGWQLHGVNGPAPASEAFAQFWAALVRTRPMPQTRQVSYELRQVQRPKLPAGEVRLAELMDAPQVLAMLDAMQQELDLFLQPAWTLEKVQLSILKKNVFVWQSASGHAAMAMTTRPTRQSVTISSVYTLPAARNQGIASALTALLAEEILSRGYRQVNLFADKANPVSNHIYQAIGFVARCEYQEIDFAAAPDRLA